MYLCALIYILINLIMANFDGLCSWVLILDTTNFDVTNSRYIELFSWSLEIRYIASRAMAYKMIRFISLKYMKAAVWHWKTAKWHSTAVGQNQTNSWTTYLSLWIQYLPMIDYSRFLSTLRVFPTIWYESQVPAGLRGAYYKEVLWKQFQTFKRCIILN